MNLISASLFALMVCGAAAAPASGAGDRDLVRVNGTPIRESEVVERLLKRYGQQTVDEMIDEILLRQAAVDAGIKSDDAEVEKRFGKLVAQFGSRELFLSQLERAGSSVSKVKEELAEEVVHERLVIRSEGISVTDAEVKKAFAERRDKLSHPEAIHLRHILVAKESDAKAIVDQLNGGADFAQIAREKSLAASGKAVGGDYGFIARGMLPADVDEIAFAMKPGEIKIVTNPLGTHVLQVLEKRPSKPATFAEVKDDLREILLSEKIKAAAPGYMQKLRGRAEIKSVPAAAP
jgi:foldase protein PrsA